MKTYTETQIHEAIDRVFKSADGVDPALRITPDQRGTFYVAYLQLIYKLQEISEEQDENPSV